MQQAYMFLNFVDDLRIDMIAKYLSSRTKVVGDEHSIDDSNCIEMTSNRNTISSDDCVCRWIQEGKNTTYDRNTHENVNVCTYIQLDQSFMDVCNEEINDDLQLENERIYNVVYFCSMDSDEDEHANDLSKEPTQVANYAKHTHDGDTNDEQKEIFLFDNLPFFVPIYYFEVIDDCLHEDSIGTIPHDDMNAKQIIRTFNDIHCEEYALEDSELGGHMDAYENLFVWCETFFLLHAW